MRFCKTGLFHTDQQPETLEDRTLAIFVASSHIASGLWIVLDYTYPRLLLI